MAKISLSFKLLAWGIRAAPDPKLWARKVFKIHGRSNAKHQAGICRLLDPDERALDNAVLPEVLAIIESPRKLRCRQREWYRDLPVRQRMGKSKGNFRFSAGRNQNELAGLFRDNPDCWISTLQF